jgi:hypothetical protein
MSYWSGKFWTNNVLLGGRYSSGMTAEAEALVDLRPAPRVVLAGRESAVGIAAEGRLSNLACSEASAAFFLSEKDS